MRVIFATGHRPPKLGGYSTTARLRLEAFARLHLAGLPAGAPVIVGMAQGWDQAVAQACLDLGLPYWAYVPCRGQSDPWPPEAQARYENLLGHAEEVVLVSEVYDAACMGRRNQAMVDDGDECLALWDGSLGGTADCIRRAQKAGKTIRNLWEEWRAQ